MQHRTAEIVALADAGLLYRDIGIRYGVSRQRVHQIVVAAGAWKPRPRRKRRVTKAMLAERLAKGWPEHRPPGECWVWTGPCYASGYGRSGQWSAHRLSWTVKRKRIPKGLHVLHHCDNPPCVNPDHLYVGTPADNARDRTVRGRGGHRTSKLNSVHVRMIRSLYRRNVRGVGYLALSHRFGVSVSTIRGIVNQETWTHIS